MQKINVDKQHNYKFSLRKESQCLITTKNMPLITQKKYLNVHAFIYMIVNKFNYVDIIKFIVTFG